MAYTNRGNISLTIAVWLAADDGYDRKFHPMEFSATEILDPVRMIVLKRQLAAAKTEGSTDIEEKVPSRVGHAVHKAAEVSWIENREKAFKNLGLPQSLIDRIRVNPETPGPSDSIDIHIEKRTTKDILGYRISGMFDFCIDGVVEDIKTTKTYNWIHGGNDEKYMHQESIYRWLNPELIIGDFCNIHFMFTDWKAHLSIGDKEYPPANVMTRKLKLMSLEETEQFISNKLLGIIPHLDKQQEDLPQCTQEELWQNPPTYKWYKGGVKTARSSKNFDTKGEAEAHSAGVGIIITHPAKVKRCYYCDARLACTQAAQLSDDGLLN